MRIPAENIVLVCLLAFLSKEGIGQTLNDSSLVLIWSTTKKLAGIVAVAGLTNQSPYTRFSQSGGGQLEGFEQGVQGQYRVNQLMQESAGLQGKQLTS